MADAALTPDLCIIGAGPAGLSLAKSARGLGASVVLVESGRMGGEELNAGLPSKALAASGRLAQAMREASRLGIANDEPRPNFRAVHDHVQSVIARIAPNESVARFAALGVEIVRAHAAFLDKRTLKAGDTLIRARRFVIATGSHPLIPEIPGLAQVPYFTTSTIFENTRKLTHLVVIGGGPAGIELAQAYRRLGSEVTLIEAARPLSRVDPELCALALGRLRAEGVDLREGTRVTRIIPRGQGIGVVIQPEDGPAESLDASHILVAVGRAANLDALALEAARIRRDPVNPARLHVRANLRTTNRRVYAIGDAAGGLQSSHSARYQARLVLRGALFGLPARTDETLVPRLVFTDPEIAEVGLTEPQARARFKDRYRLVRVPLAESERAAAMGETLGLAKLIADPRGRILGAGVVGPEAGELIALFSLAIASRLSVEHLDAFVAPYPTLSEAASRLGAEAMGDRPANPWAGRLLALLRHLP